MPPTRSFVELRQLLDQLGRGIELRDGPAPKPKPGKIVVYAQKNGLGKMELKAQAPTGAAGVLFTEP